MELHLTAQLARAAGALEVCARYLDRLPLAAERRRELLRSIAERSGKSEGDTRHALAVLHETLAGRRADPANPAYASIHHRLEIAYTKTRKSNASNAQPVVTEGLVGERLDTAPPLVRTSMVPSAWPLGIFRRLFRLIPRRRPVAGAAPGDAVGGEGKVPADSPDPHGQWHTTGTFRRIALLGLIVAQTYIATNFMTAVLPYHGRQPLEIAMLILFAILFGWVSIGFWTAIAGFVLLLFGGDRYAISRRASGDAPLDEQARTAIVMPIRNEHVPRVFAGLRATYESVARTGNLQHFDFFVLSDTSDPDTRVAEIEAWLEMCLAVNGFGRVFYRWRQHRIKRKSGNIADFCRRWGSRYRYMVVMDADSVMSGDCLTTLLRLIEANPNAGIIQTATIAAGRETLFARVHQFATRVYGPLFTAGLHFWQLGESYYWGHNAIIRLAPFIRHCGLRRLPGRGTLSGEILSHDFVEAALMRRAGWAVWIAYDLPGSYEEMPPSLLDELKRDRRWCQGNLMNFRLFLLKGLHVAHRAVFMSGVMAYLSALLWFVFLLLSTALLAVYTLSEPKYFVRPYQLFPLWPEWHPQWAVALFGATIVLLFLPKLLAAVLVAVRGAERFGGGARLTASMLAEFSLSTLLAPIRMLFHTQFVVAALIGLRVQWKSPPREDAETTWREAVQRHGLHSMLGVLWAGTVYWLNPSFLWWLLPVVGALMASIPISVYTSRISLGRRLRQRQLFVTPEEADPPAEIAATIAGVRNAPRPPGFDDAIVDPAVNALACGAGVVRSIHTEPLRNGRETLLRKALSNGPDALSPAQKLRLLGDPVALSQLHLEVWASPDAHAAWREACASPGRSCQIIAFPAREPATEPVHLPTEV